METTKRDEKQQVDKEHNIARWTTKIPEILCVVVRNSREFWERYRKQ